MNWKTLSKWQQEAVITNELGSWVDLEEILGNTACGCDGFDELHVTYSNKRRLG
jgi:hypothetical protein